MSRKKPTARVEFQLFDILYEDGSRSSNRKIPMDELGILDPETAARDFLEAQERKIVEQSGRARPAIKSIQRADR